MNKTPLRGLATAALTTMLTVTGVTAATAADCTPSEGTPATFGDWAGIDYTGWTKAPSMPADPDGQSGDENPLNDVRIGAPETRSAETAVREDSGWVRTAPEGPGWADVDGKVVTDTEASDERVLVTPAVPAVESVWANFSPNKDTGPFDGPPTYSTDSRGTWQVHDQIPGGHADEPDGVYQQGHGTAHGSWFYKQVGSAEVPAVYETVHHDAVTHNEYRYQRTTSGVTEYRWVIEKRTTSEGTEAVLCGTEQPNTPATGAPRTPGDTPTTPVTPAAPIGTSPTTAIATTFHPTPVVLHASTGGRTHGHRAQHVGHDGSTATAVPTVIDAGL